MSFRLLRLLPSLHEGPEFPAAPAGLWLRESPEVLWLRLLPEAPEVLWLQVHRDIPVAPSVPDSPAAPSVPDSLVGLLAPDSKLFPDQDNIFSPNSLLYYFPDISGTDFPPARRKKTYPDFHILNYSYHHNS